MYVCIYMLGHSVLFLPVETPAVESGDGERRAVRPGKLHLRGAEQVWLHLPHLPAGCAR